ncbi:T9SS type A sorting domain-containing protein [uncultured Flavobacterium sp.]|uniref:T9SS type A sorting domain-containing protein n=1 Tax=uncultured Flavobacterium sp. TaxID=165435 RepID=UPI0025F2A178|nr:T9SS type A sorting domain-containing protein [uncultured Flavobacterium sp.]
MADSDFKAWPNPVTDYLHLDYDGSINDVTIYDMQGQVVVVENIDRNLRRLDMSGLTEGNYVMKVYTGNELRTIPIVKN